LYGKSRGIVRKSSYLGCGKPVENKDLLWKTCGKLGGFFHKLITPVEN
jgi:hypothetical protein